MNQEWVFTTGDGDVWSHKVVRETQRSYYCEYDCEEYRLNKKDVLTDETEAINHCIEDLEHRLDKARRAVEDYSDLLSGHRNRLKQIAEERHEDGQ